LHTLLAVPILALVLMLQTIVASTLPLLSGFADLVMLVLVAWSLQERVRSSWSWALIAGALVGTISAVPILVTVVSYLLITGIAHVVRRRVWQSPILAMFLVTFLGSLIYPGLTMAVLIATGTPLQFENSLNLVILPGTLLNILLALPVYAVITDLAQLAYPDEVEV
jgi:cell shape-determining protein MreD